MIWAKTGDDEVAKVPGNTALTGGGQGASVGRDDQLHCQDGHQTRLEAPQLRGGHYNQDQKSRKMRWFQWQANLLYQV